MTIFESICDYLRTVEKDKEMTNWNVYGSIIKVCNIDTVGKCLRLLEKGGYLKAGRDQHGFKLYKVTSKPIPIDLTESELKDRLEGREQRLDRKYKPSVDLIANVNDLVNTVRSFKSIIASVEEVQAQEITLSKIQRLRVTLRKCNTTLAQVAHRLDAIHETYTYDLERLTEQPKFGI